MRYYYLAKIRVTISSVGEDVKQLEFSHIAYESINIPSLWKTTWQIFIKFNISYLMMSFHS